MTDQELAQLAYEAYARKHSQVLGPSGAVIADRPVRAWDDLTDDMRRCWVAAISAVVDAMC